MAAKDFCRARGGAWLAAKPRDGLLLSGDLEATLVEARRMRILGRGFEGLIVVITELRTAYRR